MADEGASFLARLGAWGGRRAEPRLWISLAGAGCALAVVGVVMISGDAQAGDEGLGDGSRVPGILLCLAVAAAGYVLVRLFGESPAASAGVTAIALAVPPLFYFLTFDDDGLPPWSAEGILALSALVWLVSYIVGPAKGRPLLLGAGLVAVALLAIQLAEEPFSADFEETTFVQDAPFPSDEPLSGDDPFADDDSFTGETDQPDPTTIGIILLLFGAAYLAAARLLDHRGFAGTATAVRRRGPRRAAERDRLPRRRHRGSGRRGRVGPHRTGGGVVRRPQRPPGVHGHRRGRGGAGRGPGHRRRHAGRQPHQHRRGVAAGGRGVRDRCPAAARADG